MMGAMMQQKHLGFLAMLWLFKLYIVFCPVWGDSRGKPKSWAEELSGLASQGKIRHIWHETSCSKPVYNEWVKRHLTWWLTLQENSLYGSILVSDARLGTWGTGLFFLSIVEVLKQRSAFKAAEPQTLKQLLRVVNEKPLWKSLEKSGRQSLWGLLWCDKINISLISKRMSDN